MTRKKKPGPKVSPRGRRVHRSQTFLKDQLRILDRYAREDECSRCLVVSKAIDYYIEARNNGRVP